MTTKIKRLNKYLIYPFLWLLLLIPFIGTSQNIEILPTNPSVGNCIPLGSTSYMYSGMVYANIPAFELGIGDDISFDTGNFNDVIINRDIYFAAATTNGGAVPIQWVQVVSASDHPANPLGNAIVGDFELTYTANNSFSFTGGGLLVAFGIDNSFTDGSCTQNNVITNSNDPSGYFIKRFCFVQSLTDGVEPSGPCGGPNVALWGMKINAGGSSCTQDITCPANTTVQCGEDTSPANTGMATIPPNACPGMISFTDMFTPACGSTGTITRTWTATDDNGNTVSCDQTITIVDNTAPTFDQSPLPMNMTVECDAVPPPATLTASDNCVMLDPFLFINEFHYDNVGGDTGEFIEVVGTAGYDLSNCQLVLYNGANGQTYNTIALSGMIDNEGMGIGAVDFQLPSNGLQNGAPDGIALVCNGVVEEFISYEGSFVASNGPAAGTPSTDVGVSEGSGTPVGSSLQLTGTGCLIDDFTWTVPAPASPGSINTGQTFDPSQCSSSSDVPVVFMETTNTGACLTEGTITRTWTATDACGNPVSHTQTINIVDNTAPTFCDTPADITVTCDIPAAETASAVDNCAPFGVASVWINEFHYDNTGTDTGESVEIAGQAGTNLSGYQIVLYNGANGLLYDSRNLSGIIDNESCNYGALAFGYPSNGIQNGPDGIALIDNNGNVLEFISYEGTFVANNGPAATMVSTNVGVSEGGGTPVGQSLQLTGSGGMSSDFTWTGPVTASPGSLNAGQTILGPGVTVTVEDSDPVDVCIGGILTRTYTATDDCGNSDTYVQTITVLPAPPPMITCPDDIVVECEDQINLNPNDAMATSQCGTIVSIYIKNPLAVGAPGCDGTVYTYIYVAVDDCGNSSECEQQVLIQNTPATITPPPGGIVSCYEDIDISVDDATVNDACAEYDLYLTAPELDGPLGCPGTNYTFTYNLVDVCGNTITEDVVFTNGNNEEPTIEAPADITCECLAGVNPNPDLATVTTACGDAVDYTVTVSEPVILGPIDCPGTTYAYTYTVTDACGRTATDVQTFTVNNGPPVFIDCPEDNWLVLNCEDFGGQDGAIQVIEAWIASVTAVTSCGAPLTVLNNFNPNNVGSCIDNGFMTVTFRATDNCGRQTECEGVVVITDTEAPEFTVLPEDHFEICNFSTNANLQAWANNLAGAEAWDGCSNDNVNWTISPGNPTIDCFGSSDPVSVTVTFIVTDNCGNKTSETATFTALPPPEMGGNNPGEFNGDNDGISLFQNQPNPFAAETEIGFYLPVEMEATLTIYDVSGRLLKEMGGEYSKGFHTVDIQASELNASGLLFYQLNTAYGSITKRMTIID